MSTTNSGLPADPGSPSSNPPPAISFVIAPATWHDLGSLRTLEREAFGADAWPLLDLLGVLTLPSTVRLKAVVGDLMVGFVAGDIRRGEQLGWITTIGVTGAYRRMGIGRALLVECEKQMGMPTVRLCVRRSNQPAIEMYHRMNYYQVDIWRNYYIGGEDALVLEKKIA